jgi:hypothetical protein
MTEYIVYVELLIRAKDELNAAEKAWALMERLKDAVVEAKVEKVNTL